MVDRWWRPELRRRAVDGPTASLDTKINGRRRRRRFNEERRAPIDFSASPNDSPPPPPLPDPPDWITRTALNLRRAISAAAACNLETASSARRGRCAVGRRPPVSRRIVAAAVGKNDGETTEPKSAPTFFSHGRHVYGGHSLDPLRFCFFVIRADVFSGVPDAPDRRCTDSDDAGQRRPTIFTAARRIFIRSQEASSGHKIPPDRRRRRRRVALDRDGRRRDADSICEGRRQRVGGADRHRSPPPSSPVGEQVKCRG